MATRRSLGSTAQMPLASPSPNSKNEPDALVPDPQVCREFGVTAMTLWRWDRDPTLDFPTAISIRNWNFRSRKLLESFKARMLQRAIRTRKTGSANA